MKNYVGFSRDHSVSMRSIVKAAARDYNSTIETIKSLSLSENQDTIVSVVRCGGPGSSSTVDTEIVNSSVTALVPLSEGQYQANGSGTPLFDSIGALIELFEATPDANDPDVSFLITAITDGDENSSRRYTAASIASKIKQLQSTDRWTFAFRVPKGYARVLTKQGIPEGNILEWDTSETGLNIAAKSSQEAFTAYYSGLSRGVKSTDKFFTNIAHVSQKEVKQSLTDISKEVSLWEVQQESAIRPFVEEVTKGPMIRGSAFYQLTKPESEVQDYKQIAIRDRTSGDIYSGGAARQMLNLPTYGTVKVAPGDHGNYDIYIQSTSVNRKLPTGTKVLIWPNAGVIK